MDLGGVREGHNYDQNTLCKLLKVPLKKKKNQRALEVIQAAACANRLSDTWFHQVWHLPVNLQDITSMLTNEQLGDRQHLSGLLHPPR